MHIDFYQRRCNLPNDILSRFQDRNRNDPLRLFATTCATISSKMKPNASNHQKISISLPQELIRYAETYQEKHGLPSRSDVIAEAMKALREKELAHAYRAWAAEQTTHPDPLLELGTDDGLEPSTEHDW